MVGLVATSAVVTVEVVGATFVDWEPLLCGGHSVVQVFV